MSALKIQPLNDVTQVVDLYLAVFNAPPWNDGWTLAVAAERLAAIAACPRYQGWVAVEDAAPLAFALGWGERWTTGWQFHLKEFAVLPSCQRRGIGSGLLRTLEQQLATQGFQRVELQTAHAAPARRFYERHGFQDMHLASMGKGLAVERG